MSSYLWYLTLVSKHSSNDCPFYLRILIISWFPPAIEYLSVSFVISHLFNKRYLKHSNEPKKQQTSMSKIEYEEETIDIPCFDVLKNIRWW